MDKSIYDIIFTITIIGSIALIVVLIFICKSMKRNNVQVVNNQTSVTTAIQTEQNEEPITATDNMPYRKKFLLTKNEWTFYKSLKSAADELGYTVLSKIRVADLIEVTSKDRAEWQKYFNKISKKHIDFVLAKPENLQIVLLIELDDNSHNDAQKDRDNFMDELYKQTGYKLLRTRGTNELKQNIENILKNTKQS